MKRHLSGCSVDEFLTDELFKIRRLCKKAVKNAKKDYKCVRTDRLRSDLIIAKNFEDWQTVI